VQRLIDAFPIHPPEWKPDTVPFNSTADRSPASYARDEAAEACG
jgi:hypothetical protein